MSKIRPDQSHGTHVADSLAPPDNLADLGEWLDALIQGFAAHPDHDVRARVFALLDGIDALHRASLERFVSFLDGPAAKTVWARVQDDQLVRTLLLLYDVLPPPEPPRRKVMIPLRLVEPAPPSRVSKWFDVMMLDEAPPGELRGMRVGDHAILICRLGDQIFAYHDACPDTPLALSLGQLDGEQIVCPWHGCRFDARTGERLEHRGTGLESMPVTVEDNRVRVELDVA